MNESPAPPPSRQKPASTAPPVPGLDRKATLPPPRPKSPSQGPPSGAMSSRLALPPNPSAGGSVDEAARTSPAPRHEPMLLIQSTGPVDPARMMTVTANVEPLSYGAASSGSMPPLGASYGHPPLITSSRRTGLIAAAIIGGVALIGVLAMVLGGDDTAAQGGGAPPVAAKDSAPDPVESVGVAPDPVVKEPEPEVTDPEPEVTDPEPAVKAPDPVVKAPDPVVKEPDPVVKEPDPVVKKAPEPVVKKKPPGGVAKKKPDPVVKKADPPKKATGVDAAKKKAAALYASKDFKGAAAAARDAASTADDADAAALRKLANDYEQFASSWAAGNAAAATKPTDALTAYKRALAADKKLGGTHAAMVREKLGQVAPKAAAGFMAKGNYEAAKQAADTAVNFGAGSSPTVAQVRQSLERKAAELYANGMKLMKTSPEEGKALLRRVLKIVPPDSPSYQKAYKAVNTRSKARDDDE
jgi:hypothetical protein